MAVQAELRADYAIIEFEASPAVSGLLGRFGERLPIVLLFDLSGRGCGGWKGHCRCAASIRVPNEIMKLSGSAAIRNCKDRSVAMLGKVTQSTVLKLALLRGLAALEQEYK